MHRLFVRETEFRTSNADGTPGIQEIEEATIDAYGESEQLTGWFTMFEEYLALPFETTVLGTTVTVASIELRDGAQVVAICTRGRYRQALSLADLPLPTPAPAGSEWIQAYRHWLGRR